MEYFGLLSFILVLVYSGLPRKVTRLSRRLNRLERKQTKKGEKTMSEIIKGLVGKTCKITESDGISSTVVKVIEVDEEWIRMEHKNAIVIKRIDDLREIRLVES